MEVVLLKRGKKNVLFFRTGPPAVNPKILLQKTDWGIPFSRLILEIELKRCDW